MGLVMRNTLKTRVYERQISSVKIPRKLFTSILNRRLKVPIFRVALTQIATVLTQATQAEAQRVLEAYPGDPFKLDRDKDSIACETLR